MSRHWFRASRAFASVGLVYAAVGVACGGGSNGTGDTGTPTTKASSKDAGQKDSTATVGDDLTGDDGQDDATSDATTDDATDAGDAGDDVGDAGGDDTGDDGASVNDAAADGGVPLDGSAGDGGLDASGAPTDGGATTDSGSTSDSGTSGTPDAGIDASTVDSGSTGQDASTCNFAGTWATAIAIDVTWAAGGTLNIVIAPGSGTIKQWLLSTRTQTGTTVMDTTTVCGIQLPDFSGNPSLVKETYGIRFPDSLFDSGDLTSFAIAGTVSGSTPTATYTTTPAAALLGLTLVNATTAAWPDAITTPFDEDGDGKTGVTANVLPPGGGYSNVPLDLTVTISPGTVARADRLYLALRQITSVNAKFSDCDHASGSVTVPVINKKYAIDSHVIGCRVAGGTTDCTADQTSFVDGNHPVFVPGTTTYTSARVANTATCASVRAQFP